MILITGGTGFIGNALKRELDKSRESYVCINRSDLETINKTSVPEDVDWVIHCAANPSPKPDYENPDDLFESNVMILNRLLSKCRNIKHFTFLSSTKVYGRTTKAASEAMECKPACLYGISKLAAEKMVEYYAQAFHFTSTILRLCPVVGLEQTHGIVKDFRDKIGQDGRYLDIIGSSPGSYRPYIHVSDAVSAILHSRNIRGVFNVSNDDLVSNLKLAKIMLRKVKSDKEIRFLGSGTVWDGDLKKTDVSTRLIRSTGWFPYFSSEHAIGLSI